MAHLDHVGCDPALPGDRIFNGAMDNAAGTAAMLEAARGFVESGVRPRRSILFAAVTAEEKGLLGSAYLARYPVVGAGKVVGVVNLDMPVLLYDFHDVVAFAPSIRPWGRSSRAPRAERASRSRPIRCRRRICSSRSDHYSFVRAGVPSVFLVTGFENGGKEAFEKFLATTYHQVGDDIGQPFDWQAGAKFARINYLIAREIADGDEPPRWYQGNPYGDRFAPGQPRAPRPEARTP
ncbi:MAG: M20/M25/M40 family metallo-hydrolase [Sphingomonas sp.]